MKLVRRRLAVSALAGVVLLSGCSSATDDAVGASEGAEHLITLAVVPGQDLGLLYAPEVQEIFEEQGVRLEITEISGSDAVESVTSRQYDLSYSSYVPPVLGLDQGADLRVISGLSNLGPAGTNGSTLVQKDSGINTWADLQGGTVATQSARSISSLALQAAIRKDAGDSANLANLVPTPSGRIAAILAAGEVNAGDLVEPYASAATENYPDQLVDIGDAKEYVLGKDTPLTAFFTTTETANSKAATFTAFRTSLDRAVKYGNANPAEVKKGGAGQAGLSEEVALTLPDSVYASSATAEELRPVVDLMLKMQWIAKAPDLNSFAAG